MNKKTSRIIKDLINKGFDVYHTVNGHYFITNPKNNKKGSFWVEDDEIRNYVAIHDNDSSPKETLKELLKYLKRD